MVGWSQRTTIKYTDSSDKANDFMNGGKVIGTEENPKAIGGLVGWNQDGCLIENATTKAEVTSDNGERVGGLVGANEGGYVKSIIKNCWKSEGNVSGKQDVGGLVGMNYHADVDACFVKGITVTGTGTTLGGLVGWNRYWEKKDSAIVSKSYAKNVVVNGNDNVGGLVGANDMSFINDSYVLALDKEQYFIEGNANVGGLVGYAYADKKGCIFHSYAAIKVGGKGRTIRGLVGDRGKMHILSSYWDTTVSGQIDTGAGVPKTTGEMMQKNTYKGWNEDIWDFKSGDYPNLKWEEETSASSLSYGLGSEGLYL